MRNHLGLILLIALHLSCSTSHYKDEVEYIKIITFSEADSVTLYNKGEGLFRYLYYDPKKDSVILRVPVRIDSDTVIYETSIGEFNNSRYVDTLLSAVKTLRRENVGIIPDRSGYSGDGGYSGPTFYFEFKDKHGLFCYYFQLDINDTLNRFSDFYHRLGELPWKREQVENNLINSDTETVSALKHVGVYEKLEAPYIPLSCGPGIDFLKVYGNWRSIGNEHSREQSKYLKLSLKKDGTFSYGWVPTDSSSIIVSGTYRLNERNNRLTLDNNQSKRIYQILKLSETCFEYVDVKRSDTIRMDRLSTTLGAPVNLE
ncbi:hypothetical protein WG954_07090 [Lacibacter sp. H375]|uniref:hypothetical protein n=1 Tax=Lacibacter sp. H375 TaxID=3133424 RepID=UPI0030BBC18A